MIDPELKKELGVINENLVSLRQKGGWWKSLLHGLMTGLGSVFGVVLALAIIGWLLNVAGVIPAFRNEANQWKELIDQAQQQRLPTKSQNTK